MFTNTSTRSIRNSIKANNNLLERADKNAQVVDEWYKKKCNTMAEAFSKVPDDELLPIKMPNGMYSLENLESNMKKIISIQEEINKSKETKEDKVIEETKEKTENVSKEVSKDENSTSVKAVPLY